MLKTDIGISKQDKTVYLKDYQAPDFGIVSTDLTFELGEEHSRVTSKLSIKRSGSAEVPLILDGEKLSLISIELDGKSLDKNSYQTSQESLTIESVPDEFELTIVTQIEPQNNTELSGLYKSSGNFCTQCEAEGFRRITYFLDRPDVLSKYSVKIIADKAAYPVLLSNGNPQGSGELDKSKHWAKWVDPHPKPSYLFALVAGDLKHIADEFVTASGNTVDLRIYTQAHNIDKCEHAMASLKHSMTWDEKVYGREYDLDVYNIVAVDDFNMGAMENKGLNIFNSKFVLADTRSATDADFDGIESVIAHEYFHNWSGNRVTCRDWFQLSLKEGFTVFRDQEFSADMGSRGVKRVKDVNLLRNYQFKEDGGPMAHPVRPDSYQEINNFYTVTIYEKGAEVIRMMYHLLGAAGFRKGCDYYFAKFDGQAVTTEDFVQAMEKTNGVDLAQFRLWYTQAGTPTVSVSSTYSDQLGLFQLDLRQSIPDTPGQADKKPMQIPIALALFDQQGAKIEDTVVSLSEQQQTISFSGLNAEPKLSFLRGFSAPIKVALDQSIDDLAWLAKNDDDGFVRWESGQKLAQSYLLAGLDNNAANDANADELYKALSGIFEFILTQQYCDDWDLVAQMLELPSESYLGEQCRIIDPVAIHERRQALIQKLASDLDGQFVALYQRFHDPEFVDSKEGATRRAVKNATLCYLASLGDEHQGLIKNQFDHTQNMTDQIAAFCAALDFNLDCQGSLITQFYQQWQDNNLVLDKWFSMQAGAIDLGQIKSLMQHAKFSLTNPNNVRALIGGFVAKNVSGFHHPDGSGYRFLADTIIQLNSINPQIAARLSGQFNNWKKLKDLHKNLMHKELQRIASTEGLSKDIREIVDKALS